jgi:hypothetical protein
VIKSESIDTNEPQRDEHLQSADFFDAANFPEINFESTEIGGVDGTSFKVVGDLTIRGTTRPIELEATFEGAAKDPWGNDRIGLTVKGNLDPNDYGVDWNQELEAGGNLLGDRVDFTASVLGRQGGVGQMRVLGIAGSLRSASYNRGLLRAAQELAPAGMEIDLLDIRDLPFYDGDVEAAGVPEPVQRLPRPHRGGGRRALRDARVQPRPRRAC